MKKQVKYNQFQNKKFDVNRETIRNLNRPELESAKGGVDEGSLRTSEI